MFKDIDDARWGAEINSVDNWRQKAATCQALAEKANTPEGKTRWAGMARFWLAKIQRHEQQACEATQPPNRAPE